MSHDELNATEFGRRAFLVSIISVLATACGTGTESAGTPANSTAVPGPTTTSEPPTVATEQVATVTPPPAEPTVAVTPAPPPFSGDPFTLGVASGDPRHDSVILWTRLAPDPHNPDPAARNGMPDADVAVKWEVAIFDGDAGEVVAQGTEIATASLGHSVHVDVRGLPADTWFSYRFIIGEYRSPVGRTRTMPEQTALQPMAFAFSSCQQRETGYYAAHRSLAEAGEDIDLFFWLGDYIYEYGPSADPVLPERVHDSPEVKTVEAYRNRYALYRSDPDLQAHHATRPWVVTWDDHEVDNDYAGDMESGAPVPVGSLGVALTLATFRARRFAAYQAWYEHMPVRLDPPKSADYKIYRDVRWGALAHFLVLDGRQFRSPQPTDGEFIAVPGVFEDPSVPIRTIAAQSLDRRRTMLGTDQEQWVARTSAQSPAQWKVLAQQTMMHGLSIVPGADPPMTPIDTWDGYSGFRKKLLERMGFVSDLVVLTGDFHAQSAANLKPDPFDRLSPVVAAEFMSGAISSQFLPVSQALIDVVRGLNPHIRHLRTGNGYVVCTVTEVAMEAAFYTVTDVLNQDSVVAERARFRVDAGVPGISAAL